MERSFALCSFLIGAIFATHICTAGDETGREPAELVQARAAWQSQLKAATEPINLKYMQTLDAMKRKFGGAGDLDNAQRVQHEIESLSGKKSAANSSVKGGAGTAGNTLDVLNAPEPAKPKDAGKVEGVVQIVNEFPDRVFELKDGRIPNELNVEAVDGGFRISGTKATDATAIEGRLAGWSGKAVLFPVRACSGQIDPVVPFKADHVMYCAVSSAPGNKALLQYFFPKEKSTWAISRAKGGWQLQLGDKIIPFPDKTTKVGFGATVRWPGDVADLVVTIK
ncbi:MAG TPA: hypothetical protein DET40_04685 [Lentisphaeria bacterium]|nr:MAG: hypothetical protein A2X45_21440 [Lentisphaerae bacterium GWF2_50_93]HCE42821.1 hypothetical protein [Lentisphaeria bacterium]